MIPGMPGRPGKNLEQPGGEFPEPEQSETNSPSLEKELQQKQKELFEVLGVENREEAKNVDLNTLEPETIKKARDIADEIKELRGEKKEERREKEFNPEKEKEKLIEWAKDNLAKSTEEAEEFIDEYFIIDKENEGIVVEKYIDLTPYNETLKEIPDNITVKGSAKFQDCTSLEKIPDNITFGGNANFGGCTSLKEIPDNITFGGHASFRYCTSLEKIPDNVTFKGNAYFTGCTSLKEIPDNLTFKGSVDFAGCTSLEKISDNITFEGGAGFAGCTSLEKIPDNITFGSFAYFSDCTSLKEIPGNITFGGYAYFTDCTSLDRKTIKQLKQMKKGGKIKGDLHLPNGKTFV